MIGGVTIPTPHSRTFDAYNKHWSSNAQTNKIFLLTQQNYFNDVLQSRGHVFLNEIYDSLGFSRSSVGQLVGWTKDGDVIDFCMAELEKDGLDDHGFALDFNVQGVIYDKI